MNIDRTWRTEFTSLEATLKLARIIGERLKGGEVIELISDLGGGKTAFVRGLATGIGSADAVRSPSFTLSNEYQGRQLKLYHFDFYRLNEPGVLKDELAEVLNDNQAVVAIEWADIVEDVLPASRVTIKITAKSETSRLFEFKYPTNLSYLFPNAT